MTMYIFRENSNSLAGRGDDKNSIFPRSAAIVASASTIIIPDHMQTYIKYDINESPFCTFNPFFTQHW